MVRLKRVLLPLSLGLLVLVGAVVVRASDPGFTQIVRERVFDLYQRVDPPQFTPDLPIRIVDVDDASLARHGQWPWPRTRLATMVDVLHAAGAAVIAFDMLFPEPDRASPDQAIAALDLPAPTRARLRTALAGRPSHDDVFARALAAAPSVLGVATAQSGNAFTARAGLATVGPDATPLLTSTPALVTNLPHLEDAAQGLGGIHVSARDDDAVVRRIPVLTSVGEAIMPSLFIEALRVAQGAQSLVLRTNPAPEAPELGIPQDLRVGALTLPLSADGTYRIRYGTLDPSMTLSANRIFEAIDNPARLANDVGGTLVLVGTSAPGLFDLRATPLGTIVPGVTMHAQAIANVVIGRHLARPDWAIGLEIMLVIGGGLLVLAGALMLRPSFSAGLALATMTLIAGGSWWAFSTHLLLIDASFAILSTIAVFGAVTVPVLVGTDQRQRFIRNAFAHYLAEPVLARLENDPDALKLDGERRTISVLFMDIRGFTARSETLEPTQAVDLLNGLLDPLSEAVLAEEGTIDKFMGDGMMAFWNAPLDQPDHAARAVRAALAMTAALKLHNQRLSGDGRPLAIGVGIHTGEAFVGNMGSKRRFAYSAIGDTVNLAARVEALTASQDHQLLITEETRDAAARAHSSVTEQFERAGHHQVKGRQQAVTVYTLKEALD